MEFEGFWIDFRPKKRGCCKTLLLECTASVDAPWRVPRGGGNVCNTLDDEGEKRPKDENYIAARYCKLLKL